MLTKIELHDNEFAHIHSFCGYDAPEFFEWDRSGDTHGIAMFTEQRLDDVESSKAKIKIAWLLEPEAIHPGGYAKIRSGGHELFDYVLTFDRGIQELVGAKSLFWSTGGTWIWRRDWNMYPKTRNLSMLASTTKDMAPGHRLRRDVLGKLGDRIEFKVGYGFNPLENKVLAFKDFRYSIAIENSQMDWYWTEKLVDPILCGCIPIYWGLPDIGKYWNADGIISWNTVDDLAKILDTIGDEDYERRMEAVKDNYDRARAYAIVEDYMWNSFLCELHGSTNDGRQVMK